MTQPVLFYGDDEEYAVELYDRVEVRLDGCTFNGEVTAIRTQLRAAKVRYEDWRDIARTTGNARKQTKLFGIADIDLIARDQ